MSEAYYLAGLSLEIQHSSPITLVISHRYRWAVDILPFWVLYKLVLLGIWWYRVSIGLLCLYKLKKVEIRPDVTDVFKLSHAKRDLFIVVLPGNQQGGQQKTVLTWSIWGHGVFGAQTVSFSMHRSRSIRWPVQ